MIFYFSRFFTRPASAEPAKNKYCTRFSFIDEKQQISTPQVHGYLYITQPFWPFLCTFQFSSDCELIKKNLLIFLYFYQARFVILQQENAIGKGKNKFDFNFSIDDKTISASFEAFFPFYCSLIILEYIQQFQTELMIFYSQFSDHHDFLFYQLIIQYMNTIQLI